VANGGTGDDFNNHGSSSMADRLNYDENMSGEDEFDVDQFLFDKKNSLEHFFQKVYLELSKPPYSMQFYISFTKDLIKNGTKLAPE